MGKILWNLEINSVIIIQLKFIKYKKDFFCYLSFYLNLGFKKNCFWILSFKLHAFKSFFSDHILLDSVIKCICPS